jgi:hypothetical protein
MRVSQRLFTSTLTSSTRTGCDKMSSARASSQNAVRSLRAQRAAARPSAGAEQSPHRTATRCGGLASATRPIGANGSFTYAEPSAHTPWRASRRAAFCRNDTRPGPGFEPPSR